MIDRITPVVDDVAREKLVRLIGVSDQVPVFSEQHRQWIVEDAFPTGRPAWEDVGVEMRGSAEEIVGFVAVKGRLLNATHSLLAYTGMRRGHVFVHEAATHTLLDDLARRFMQHDVVPLLRPQAGLSAPEYAEQVLHRFTNTEVRDTLVRVAQDGAAKLPAFVRATAEGLLAGRDLRRLALLVAAYRAYVIDVARTTTTCATGSRRPCEGHSTDVRASLLFGAGGKS
jgi:mannitol 2-dehydrogenase